MDFDLSARSEQWRKRLQAFFDQELLPRHRAWVEHVALHRETPPFMAELQQKARAAGLWNLGLPELASDEPGTRLSNLEYAPLAEIMGRLFWASEAFNCQAPDVPNMIALQNCANPEQKQRWLRPLLNAETRSAFGMTEPDVASSDATNIATRMVRDGDDYIINGRKWFITGAAHPRCSFLIVMGVTNSDADRTRRHSCIIVPMAAPGVRLVRSLRWMGCEDHVAPIGELDLRQCPGASIEPARRRRRRLQGRPDPVGARAHSSLHALDRAVRTVDRTDDGAIGGTLRVRTHGHSIRHRAALDRRVPRRTRAGAPAGLSLRLAARSKRPPWCVARRVADQGRGARDAAADRRPRDAGVRRDGRIGRYADPSGAGLGPSAADRRRSGRSASAADLPDGSDAVLVDRGLALSRGARIRRDFRV